MLEFVALADIEVIPFLKVYLYYPARKEGGESGINRNI
jgi:hypothetical protein